MEHTNEIYIQIIYGKFAAEFMRLRVRHNRRDLANTSRKIQGPPHRGNFLAS
jgi:hypothetical protein